MESALQRAIQQAGGVTALAKTIGTSSQAISQWKQVPVLRVIQIEAATGVSRSELRPDVYPPRKSGS